MRLDKLTAEEELKLSKEMSWALAALETARQMRLEAIQMRETVRQMHSESIKMSSVGKNVGKYRFDDIGLNHQQKSP